MTDTQHGWDLVKFGDVVNKINRKIPEKSKWDFDKYIAGEHIPSGEIRIREYGDLKGTENVLGSAFHMKFEPNDVLYVSRRAYLRKGGIVNFSGVCSNVTFILNSKEERLLNELLPFIIQTESFVKHCTDNSHGSTNPFLNWKDIASYKFSLPPLKIQKNIARILWKIEATQEKVEKLIEISQKLKRGLLEELLTKGIGHKKFKKTHMGEIPDEWIIVSIEDKNYFNLMTGGTPATSNPDYWGGDIPWLSSGELNSKQIISTNKKITESGLKNSNATHIPLFSTLIALAGQGKTRGTAAINLIELTTNQSVAAIVPNQKYVDPFFLYYYFNTKYEYLRHISGGVGRSGLSLTLLSEISIPLPNIIEQRKIVSLIKVIETTNAGFNAYRTNTMNLKKKLTNELISGSLLIPKEALK